MVTAREKFMVAARRQKDKPVGQVSKPSRIATKRGKREVPCSQHIPVDMRSIPDQARRLGVKSTQLLAAIKRGTLGATRFGFFWYATDEAITAYQDKSRANILAAITKAKQGRREACAARRSRKQLSEEFAE